jgi:hypothetical protein
MSEGKGGCMGWKDRVQILGRQVLNGLEASSGGVWVGEERRSGIGVPEVLK